MAESTLPELFALAKIARKNRHGKVRREGKAKREAGEAFTAAPGNIALYILASAVGDPIKVGVSVSPYRRLRDVELARGQSLNLEYLVEVSRADGFQLEASVKRFARSNDLWIGGEWVQMTPEEVVNLVRRMIRTNSMKVTREVGSPGDYRWSYEPNFGPDHLTIGLPPSVNRRG